jgi:hypothetical protein
VTVVRQTPDGFAVVSPSAAANPSPVDRLIVATYWSGSALLAQLHEGEPDPTPEELQAMADELVTYTGVKAVVRVLGKSIRWTVTT